MRIVATGCRSKSGVRPLAGSALSSYVFTPGMLACLLGLFLAGCAAPVSAKPVVTYPRPESLADERASYPLALLKLSLYKAGNPYQLAASAVRMQQGRSLRLLEQGKGIDLVWTVTSQAREDAFLPVRIPIDRGLIGWRLLLIRPQDRALFASVATAAALAPLRAGQGHDWPDTDVLRANRYAVYTSTSYERLFRMLNRGHIQYFPRAVTEIWSELDTHREQPLEVAGGVVLHYPEALYFFVNKSNTALAATVEKGLRIAIADGSMTTLFEHYYGDAIARGALDRRTVLRLANPLLPAATPLADQTLWYQPAPAR
jgi:hypothetical protein